MSAALGFTVLVFDFVLGVSVDELLLLLFIEDEEDEDEYDEDEADELVPSCSLIILLSLALLVVVEFGLAELSVFWVDEEEALDEEATDDWFGCWWLGLAEFG